MTENIGIFEKIKINLWNLTNLTWLNFNLKYYFSDKILERD